jgi:hypothetical protein
MVEAFGAGFARKNRTPRHSGRLSEVDIVEVTNTVEELRNEQSPRDSIP